MHVRLLLADGAAGERVCGAATARPSCRAALQLERAGEDGHPRRHLAHLRRPDWMLGNANDRNHLVLSVAPDGRNFSRHWIVRSGTPSPIAFPDPHKIPGVAQYPSGMWRGGEMVAVYSEGKENISISSFRMPSLYGQ